MARCKDVRIGSGGDPVIEIASPAALFGSTRFLTLFSDCMIVRWEDEEFELPLGGIRSLHLDMTRSGHALRLRTYDGRWFFIRPARCVEECSAFRAFALALLERSSRSNPLLRQSMGASKTRWVLAVLSAISALGVVVAVSITVVFSSGIQTAFLPLAIAPIAFVGVLPILQEGPQRDVSQAEFREAIRRMDQIEPGL